MCNAMLVTVLSPEDFAP